MSEDNRHHILIPIAAGIFTSAWLLFQVQPMIARHILPWYGGGASVWTTCMMFFQVFLLAGYAYAHLLARWLDPARQVVIHLSLLTLSLLLLPITPAESLQPDGTGNPMAGILVLLTLTVGFPYLMVSASGPLLQHWFTRAAPGQSPYRLYALSNAGSLIGLLSYPFVVEPVLTLTAQSYLWSGGYVLYVALCTWVALTLWRTPKLRQATPDQGDAGHTGIGRRAMWIALAGCGSLILLSVTNQLCQDVAVVPFLWVVPLSLYLISFILCFDSPRWYRRWIWMPFFAVTLVLLVVLLRRDYAEVEWPLIGQLAIYFSAMFACFMVCHGELVRLKPPASQLTSFYLMVSLGGALGGVFVNLVAPLIFDGFWELHLGLIAATVLAGISLLSDGDAWKSKLQLHGFQTGWALSLIVLSYLLWDHFGTQREDSIASSRSFYGVLNVYELDPGTDRHRYLLYHGRIEHGIQFQEESLSGLPTSYYGLHSGVGVAIRRHPNYSTDRLRVGVVGLGIGIIATYGREGDDYRFYEINPDVERTANEHFSYLSDSSARNTVVLGDARMSLQRELREGGSLQFDVLVVDAFSGDAVPVHLLTREAIDLYWKHLKPDGILAMHMSNLHFDLSDVVRIHARDLGKQAIPVDADGSKVYGSESNWVLITDNSEFLSNPRVSGLDYEFSHVEPREILWTDDYSNVFRILDLD